MRILVAPDGFGGTLTPVQAATAIAAGWRAAAPSDALDLAPLSDGGPGFLEVLAAALPSAVRLDVTVQDPLSRPAAAQLLLDGATAYVESAQAAGLHLLAAGELDPLHTTSYGVGQLVSAALDAGAHKVVVGLGGSATNDGGAGLLAALGLHGVGVDGRRLGPGGAALGAAGGLEGKLDRRLAEVELVLATDVDAPLLGLLGASAVFGPQKGASREDVLLLDGALGQWVEVVEAAVGRPVRDLPGAGAAGGLGAALFAVGGRREPGIALVAGLVRLDQRASRADLVVTGEGTLDGSSLQGKVVCGVARIAAGLGLPCLVLAGQVRLGRRESAAAGIDATYAVADAVGIDAALERPGEELRALSERVAREWSRPV